jgi:hypothetical protein
VLDAEAGAAGMSVVIATAGQLALGSHRGPHYRRRVRQGSAVTALPKPCGKAQVIGSQESSGETLMGSSIFSGVFPFMLLISAVG